MPAQSTVKPGEIVGQYRIIEKLGAGGMGTVYLAHDQKLGRQVAIKAISTDLLTDDDARKRFRKEAIALSKLNHPNIETVHDLVEAGDQEFIILEYIPGESLDKRLFTEGKIGEREAVRLTRQLLQGLAAAHELKILHRDLKPANLRVTPDGRLKILDFGLAKILSATQGFDLEKTESLLTAGIVGTVPYMAPEQLRGRADERTDLWAAGVILFELIGGKRPFEDATQADLIDGILNRPPGDLKLIVPNLSSGVREIIGKALQKDPASRYQSTAEMLQAVEAVAQSHAIQQRPTWIRALRIAIPVFALAASVVLFWRMEHPNPSPATPAVPIYKRSPNRAANEIYERAVHKAQEQPSVPKLREMFGEALQIDPHFAEARCWFAFTSILMIEVGYSADPKWIYEAERETRKGLEDDRDSVRCHSTLSSVYMYQGHWELSKEEALRSLALDKGALSSGRVRLALYHMMRGEYQESQRLHQELLQISPFFFIAKANYGDVARQQGDYDTAIQAERQVLDSVEHNVYAIQYLAVARIAKGDLPAARKALESALSDDRKNYRIRWGWAIYYAASGDRQNALQEMTPDMLEYAANSPMLTVHAAEFYSLLGDKQKALDWLLKANRIGDDRAQFFQRDPMLANIRQEPGFKELIDSINYRMANHPK